MAEEKRSTRTEFWVAIAGILVGVLHKKLGLELDTQSVALILGSIATYVAGRSGVKLAREVKKVN